MEKKEIIIEGPLKVGQVAVITVAEALLQCEDNHRGAIFSAAKKPLCVVLVSESARQAFAVDGEAMSLEEVLALAPDIEAVLNSL